MTPASISGSEFGIGAVSSVLSGLGAYSSGQQEKAAYDYNADVTLANMRDRVKANQQQYTKLIGTQASAYAGAGVDIASGSPLLIMAATAGRGAEQSTEIQQQGTEEAALQRYYGKIAAWSGTMRGIGDFLQGITKSATGYYGATSGMPSPTPAPGGFGTGFGWSEAD